MLFAQSSRACAVSKCSVTIVSRARKRACAAKSSVTIVSSSQHNASVRTCYVTIVSRARRRACAAKSSVTIVSSSSQKLACVIRQSKFFVVTVGKHLFVTFIATSVKCFSIAEEAVAMEGGR